MDSLLLAEQLNKPFQVKVSEVLEATKMNVDQLLDSFISLVGDSNQQQQLENNDFYKMNLEELVSYLMLHYINKRPTLSLSQAQKVQARKKSSERKLDKISEAYEQYRKIIYIHS